MGLFSDLLKKAGADTDLNELAKKVADTAEKAAAAAQKAASEGMARADRAAQQARERAEAPRQERAAEAAPPAKKTESPKGFSWGEEMPPEENQYNYGGNYNAYFSHVFAEDFPEYTVKAEQDPHRDAMFYTLSKNGVRALVVEVMPATSSAASTRKRCARENVPYLRFYHNHKGWWNTRAYVTTRVKAALG